MTTVFGYRSDNFITLTGDGVIYSAGSGKIVETDRIKVWRLPRPYSNFVISLAGNIDIALVGYDLFVTSIKAKTALWRKVLNKPNDFNFVSELLKSEIENIIQEGISKYGKGTSIDIECLVGCISKEECILNKFIFSNKGTKQTIIPVGMPVFIGLTLNNTITLLQIFF